jgi:hypothetical protein
MRSRRKRATLGAVLALVMVVPGNARLVSHLATPAGSDAVSSIAFSPKDRQLWSSESVSGFWADRLTNGVWQPSGRY